jgi:hypothetical protein
MIGGKEGGEKTGGGEGICLKRSQVRDRAGTRLAMEGTRWCSKWHVGCE